MSIKLNSKLHPGSPPFLITSLSYIFYHILLYLSASQTRGGGGLSLRSSSIQTSAQLSFRNCEGSNDSYSRMGQGAWHTVGAHVCLLNEQMNLQFTKYFLTMNPPAPHHSKQGGTHISIVQRRNVAKATGLENILTMCQVTGCLPSLTELQ